VKVLKLKRWTKALLNEYGIRPKKRLSQTFIVDDRILESINRLLKMESNETILEIGAGLGALTRKLAESGAYVLALEIDDNLVKVLKKVVGKYANVEVIKGDILIFDWRNVDKIVSNIPYHISSQIIIKLIKNMNYRTAFLLLQREFALRVIAKPGNRDYGRLTVIVSLRANARVLGFIPRRAFYPKPRVDSLLVEINPLKTPFLKDEEIHAFENFTRKLFSERRKNILKVLSKVTGMDKNDVKRILQKHSIPPDKRVYMLTPMEFLAVFRELYI